MSDVLDLAGEFESHRPYLRTVASRMLGSGDDADDAIQETWLRLQRTGGAGVVDLRAWLTTVTSRVCLDMLRTRRTRREVPVEIDLDDFSVQADAATPEDEVLLAESVGLALHVVMDKLTPAERIAFVLHDIFGLPFGQIADVLGRSTDAVKMLASRARGRVRLAPPEVHGDDPDDRAVIDAFFAAAGSGDLSALLAVLAPDAELRAFTPEGMTLVQGPAKIAAQAKLGASRSAGRRPVMRPITARGATGVLLIIDGRPISVMTFTVAEGLITRMRSVTDPDRLAQIVPSWAM
jgi:RNA polymerase sigma-70 factor (ECF subfamily)